MSGRHARESKRDKRMGFIGGRLEPRCQWWKYARRRWRWWGEYLPYPKTRGKRGWR